MVWANFSSSSSSSSPQATAARLASNKFGPPHFDFHLLKFPKLIAWRRQAFAVTITPSCSFKIEMIRSSLNLLRFISSDSLASDSTKKRSHLRGARQIVATRDPGPVRLEITDSDTIADD